MYLREEQFLSDTSNTCNDGKYKDGTPKIHMHVKITLPSFVTQFRPHERSATNNKLQTNAKLFGIWKKSYCSSKLISILFLLNIKYQILNRLNISAEYCWIISYLFYSNHSKVVCVFSSVHHIPSIWSLYSLPWTKQLWNVITLLV